MESKPTNEHILRCSAEQFGSIAKEPLLVGSNWSNCKSFLQSEYSTSKNKEQSKGEGSMHNEQMTTKDDEIQMPQLESMSITH